MNTLLLARGSLKVPQKWGYVLHQPLAGCLLEHLKHRPNHTGSRDFPRPKLGDASGVAFPDNVGQATWGGRNGAELPCLRKVLSAHISGRRGCRIEGAGQGLRSAQTFPQTAPPLLALQTQMPSQKEPLIGMTNGDFKEESVPDQYAIHST